MVDYRNLSTTVNVSSLDNFTVNTSGAYNLVLNLSVFNALNNASINNFSGTITNDNFSFSEIFSTTTGFTLINLTQNLSYFIQLDPVSGFAITNNSLNILASETLVNNLSVNISLFTSNR